MPLTDQELLQNIDSGEADRIEFKETLAGDAPTRIREAICAFANDLPDHQKPGLIFVGVKDDKTIAGVSVTDQLLQQLASMRTDGNIVPPPSMTVEKRILRGKEIALITVLPSDSPPVRYKGVIHIRTGTRRDLSTIQDERILNEKRKYRDKPFDIHPIPSSYLSDLNIYQFENEYLLNAYSSEVLEANDRSTEERLAATKMIDDAESATATVLGILIIGKNPQDFLPGAYVQFLRINGVELYHELIDSEEIRGAIPDVIRRLEDKFIAHNRTAVQFTTRFLEQRDNLYPLAALQQITRNAVMHRTYEATNAPIHVHWFNDRIEVTSPGGPFGTVNTHNFGTHGITDYRNPNLAEAMRTLGYVQRFGVGIPIARHILSEAGHPEPQFQATQDHVQVTIKTRIENR